MNKRRRYLAKRRRAERKRGYPIVVMIDTNSDAWRAFVEPEGY